MISLDQALRHYASVAALTDIETVPLVQAHRRTLARNLRSQLDLPPMRQSAMDGYALRRNDLATASERTPIRLPVQHETAAGAQASEVAPGNCARIFTGAPIPVGADAVEIQENVHHEGRDAVFDRPVQLGQNIREQGEELRCGQLVLAAGSQLSGQNISIAANAGYGLLPCRRKARVAVLVTGNELAVAGQARHEAQVFDCNGPFLRHFIAEMGAELSLLQNCRDDLEALTTSMQQALQHCDVLFVTGGASVGDHDHSRAAAQACGIEEQFWKVAQKPGKPLSYGLGPQGQAVLIMPGNPASVYMAAMVHARPLLNALQGRGAPQCISVISEQSIRADKKRERLLRASLRVENAQLLATPLAKQASHMNTNLAQTQAILRVPAGADIARGHILLAWDLGRG